VENKNHQWIIELATLIAILPMLYTAGWSYAYHYFDCFQIGLLTLDIPKEYFFLYSFWVIKGRWLIFIFVLVGLGALYFLTIHFLLKQTNTASDMKKDLIQGICVVLIPIAILLIFWLFYFFGKVAAQKAYQDQADNDFPSYPRIKVWTNPEDKEWQKGCYRVLLINSEKVYLFYPGEKKDDKIPIDVIQREKIEKMRILPQYESCKQQ